MLYVDMSKEQFEKILKTCQDELFRAFAGQERKIDRYDLAKSINTILNTTFEVGEDENV